MKLINSVPDVLVNYPAAKVTPSGTKDGANKTYTFVGVPLIALDVFVVSSLGVVTTPTFTYAIATGTSTIIFDTYAPASTDTLAVVFA